MFDLMKDELKFDEPVAMAERASLIAMLTYSKLQEAHFKKTVKKIAKKCGLGFDGAKGHGKASVGPVKGYSRSFNKIYDSTDDGYFSLDSEGGRSSYIMDPLRCLFAAPDVKTFRKIMEEILKEMDGVLQASVIFIHRSTSLTDCPCKF